MLSNVTFIQKGYPIKRVEKKAKESIESSLSNLTVHLYTDLVYTVYTVQTVIIRTLQAVDPGILQSDTPEKLHREDVKNQN